MLEQAKFTYSPLGKAFEKQIKTIEDQGEKQIKALEKHEKQLLRSFSEKESLTLLNKNKFLKNLLMKRMGEIHNLSKQIDCNLIYYFKRESDPKNFISFKGPLAFLKNIIDSYITLEKADEKLAQVKAGNTSENLPSEIRKIIYSLHQEKEVTKKVYKNTMNSIKL